MPQTVQMPDGVRLQFPDDMAHDDIREAIQTKYLGNESPREGEKMLAETEQRLPGAISVADATPPTISTLRPEDSIAPELASVGPPALSPASNREVNYARLADWGLVPKGKPVKQGLFESPFGFKELSVQSKEFPGPAAMLNTTLGVLDAATSPGGLAAGVLGAVPGMAPVIAGLFGVKAISELPQAAKDAMAVTLDPKSTPQQKNEAWMNAGVTAAQTPLVLGAVHAAIEPAKAHFENLKFDLESQRQAQETARKATLPTPMATPERVAAAGAPATAEALKETATPPIREPSAVETPPKPIEVIPTEAPAPANDFTAFTENGPMQVSGLTRSMASELATGKGTDIENPHWKPEMAPGKQLKAVVKVKDGWLEGWVRPDGKFVTSDNIPLPDWSEAKIVLESARRRSSEVPKPPAPIAPIAPVVIGKEKNLPDWAREAMVRAGLDPARPFNDIDLQNPSVREAIESDPTLTPEQKAEMLNTGAKTPALGFEAPETKPPSPSAPVAPKSVPKAEPEIIDSLLKKARSLYDAGKFVEATDVYNRILELQKAIDVAKTTPEPAPSEAKPAARKPESERIDALYKAEHDDLMDLQHRLEDAQQYEPEKIDELKLERDDAVSRLEQFDKLHKRSGEIAWEDSPKTATVKALRQNPEGGIAEAVTEGARQRRTDIENRIHDEEPVPPAAYEEYPDLKPKSEPTPIAEAGKKEASPTAETPSTKVDQPLKTEPASTERLPELWQQTQDQVWESNAGAPLGYTGFSPTKQRQVRSKFNREHKEIVEKALREGKPVPPEVLADYPDLKPTPPPAKAQAEVTKQITPGMSINEKSEILGGKIRDKILNAPSWPKLLAAAKSFRKSLHGNIREDYEAAVSEKPWELLDEHSGVMNAKSQRAKTLKALADAVIKEADLPMEKAGRYRGMDYQIDWDKLAEKPQPTPPTEASVHIQGSPQTGPKSLGIVPATSISFIDSLRVLSEPLANTAKAIRDQWRSAAMKQSPRITDSSREAGEKGVRYVASFGVARTKGLIFAEKVLQDLGVDPIKFGTALTEDNLRGIKDQLTEAAAEATEPEQQAALQEKADNVRSLIGVTHSPFKTEAEYQDFLKQLPVQLAIERHKQLWAEQKDPLFRQANDLDPDQELASRGRQTGARINLKALQPGEPAQTPIGRPPGFRQLATLKRRDPFAQRAKGSGQVYEGNYDEIMAHGFEKEMPVAAQHEFIKSLIDSGDAKVTDREVMPDFQIKGEPTKGYVMRLNPWRGKFLHVRRGLADEFEAISGLDKPLKLGVLTSLNNVMSKLSIQGLAEGSTHASNLMTSLFTGLGPTSNPLLNALVKSLGRVDLLYQLPKMVIKGFSNQREKMLELGEMGAAKEPYSGAIASRILNPVDQGVRLVSADIFDQMADAGWLEKTETNKREFINQVGQYNKRLQPLLIRKLRETGIQPFATAAQTFNVLGLRRLALAPGVKASNNAAALALKADIAGGWIGAIVLVSVLNKLISGKATGPAGTTPGAVGWIGDDKKQHEINLLRLIGFERGLRITGIGPALKAKEMGLSPKQQVEAGAASVANTVLSIGMGPGMRFLWISGTGTKPMVPMGLREAPVVPPTDSMNPLKTQLAKNIETALIESSPVTASAHDIWQGKPVSEIAQRQLTRYAPKTGMSESLVKALPRIATNRELIDYADYWASQARKLPRNERQAFIQKQLESDKVEIGNRSKVMTEMKRKGVFKYD